MQVRLGTILCKFGRDPVMFVVEEAIFVKSKVSVSRDLEHTLDAGSSGDQCVQVWWRSSHFCGRSSDLHKVYRQTDGRRTPRDCISSFQWNELKNFL